MFIWNGESGQLESRLQGPGPDLETVEFTRDGQWLAAGSASGEYCVWRRSNPIVRGSRIQHEGAPGSVSFSRDGKWLALAGAEGGIWAHATEPLAPDAAMRFHAYRLLLRPTPWGVTSNSGSQAPRVVSLDSGVSIPLAPPAAKARRAKPYAHLALPLRSRVIGLQFTASSERLLGISDEGELLVWRPPAFDRVEAFALTLGRPVGMSLSKSGNTVAVHDTDGAITLARAVLPSGDGWAVLTQVPALEPLSRVVLDADGRNLLSVGESGAIRSWDVASEHPRQRLQQPAAAAGSVAGESKDGGLSVYDEAHCRWCDVSFTRQRCRSLDPTREPCSAKTTSVIASPAGDAAFELNDGSVVILAAAADAPSVRIAKRGHNRLIPLAFHPSGEALLAQWQTHIERSRLTTSYPNLVTLFDPRTGQETGSMPAQHASLRRATFRDDGTALALWWSDGFTDNRLQLRLGIQSWASEDVRAATGLEFAGVNLVEAPSPRASAPWPDLHPDAGAAAYWQAFWAARACFVANPAFDAHEGCAAPLRAWADEHPRHPLWFELPERLFELLESL